MRQTSLLTAFLATAAIVGTASVSHAWPVQPQSPVPPDPLILAQMGGMGGGGMGGMAGGGGMGGMGGGGGMGGMGGMGGGGGMGGMSGGMGGMGGMSGGMRGGMGGGMRGNVTINRNVYVRGVRPWSSRAWYGTAIAGVTLGTIIAVSAVPPRPRDDLCWFWVDASMTSGYWDWCIPPM